MAQVTRDSIRDDSVTVPAATDIERVSDPAARDALRALSEGWEVRNGRSGEDADNFVTEGSLLTKWADQIDNYLPPNLRGIAGTGLDPATGGADARAIEKAIEALSREVFKSKLWQDLSKPIDLISAPDIGLLDRINAAGQSIADINTQVTTIVNDLQAEISTRTTQFSTLNNDLAALETSTTTSINNLQSTVSSNTTQISTLNGNVSAVQTSVNTLSNDLTAVSNKANTIQARIDDVNGDSSNISIEQKFTAIASVQDGLSAQYTVKIDNDGYVAGYGLASTPINGTPFSEFYVRADRFAVGSPGTARKVPFIVQNGVTWIDSAMIADASIGTAKIANAAITTAKIANASVDTLKIAGDAVTVPRLAYTAGGIAVNFDYNVWTTIQSVYCPFGQTVPVVIFFQALGYDASYCGSAFDCRIRRGGTTIWSYRQVSQVWYMVSDNPGGNTTYYLDTKPVKVTGSLCGTTGGPTKYQQRRLAVIGMKR